MDFREKSPKPSAPLQFDKDKKSSQSTGRISDPPHEPDVEMIMENTDLGSFVSEYHLTVRWRLSSTGNDRRSASLLLSILNYQAVHFGVNFKMFLTIQFLLEFLIGNKADPLEIKDSYERCTSYTSSIILKSIEGTLLTFEDLLILGEDTRRKLIENDLILDSRVYHSRFSHWRPEKYVSLRTVPVDLYLTRSKIGIPYSSYTKGYGEGSGYARRKGKTPYSSELDGTEENLIVFSLKEIQQYLSINQLILKRLNGGRKKA